MRRIREKEERKPMKRYRFHDTNSGQKCTKRASCSENLMNVRSTIFNKVRTLTLALKFKLYCFILQNFCSFLTAWNNVERLLTLGFKALIYVEMVLTLNGRQNAVTIRSLKLRFRMKILVTLLLFMKRKIVMITMALPEKRKKWTARN